MAAWRRKQQRVYQRVSISGSGGMAIGGDRQSSMAARKAAARQRNGAVAALA